MTLIDYHIEKQVHPTAYRRGYALVSALVEVDDDGTETEFKADIYHGSDDCDDCVTGLYGEDELQIISEIRFALGEQDQARAQHQRDERWA